MHITKFGHSCLLIEEQDDRILIDPGTYSTSQNQLEKLDAILITHEHPDHCDVDAFPNFLAKSPGAVIYTNRGAGEVLKKANINFALIQPGQSIEVKGVSIQAIGEKHAMIYLEIPIIDNTGYFIANRLFVTGDALTLPDQPVDLLTLPVCAPWLKLMDAVEYAKAVKPRVAFPVHDGVLKPFHPFYKVPAAFLPPSGIQWIVIEDGKSVEL